MKHAKTISTVQNADIKKESDLQEIGNRKLPIRNVVQCSLIFIIILLYVYTVTSLHQKTTDTTFIKYNEAPIIKPKK